MCPNANIALYLSELTEMHCFPHNEGASPLSFHLHLSLFDMYRYYSSGKKKKRKQPSLSNQRPCSHRGNIKGRLTNTYTGHIKAHKETLHKQPSSLFGQKLEHLICCEPCNALPVTIKALSSAQSAFCHYDTKINHDFGVSPHAHISSL